MFKKLTAFASSLFPSNYSFKVAAKKGAYMLLKLGAGYLAARYAAPNQSLTAEQLKAAAAASIGAELFHDYAALKFPRMKML